MKRANLPSKILLLAVVIATALVASSCENGTGVGVGTGYPTRWGGGAGGGPPIFVGGPSY
jgi:predicted small secreted protein